MPTLSAADIMRLRTTTHKCLLGLAIYNPAIIFTATVNANYARGATSIAVTSVVQTKAPARHYRVLFGTTPGGRDLGTARFKSYAAGTLIVGANRVTALAGHCVTVLEEVAVETIIPRITANEAVFEDGDLGYSNECDQYHPLARMGPPAVAFLENGTATVNFYSDSVAVAAGATLSAYAWTFPGGTPATSSSAGTSGSPIAVTWTQTGQYYCSLQVTDSNGKTHTTYRPVFILDRDNASLFYDSVEISGLEGDLEAGGWGCSLKLHERAGATQIPPQSLVVLFAQDWYGDEKVSIGGDYAHRENIVFTGYTRKGSVRKNSKTGSVEFDAQGIGRLLDNLLAWPANLKSANSPTKWHELKGMTCDLVAFHILTEHSTIDHICDVDLSTLGYALNYLDVSESTLRDQLGQQLYTANRARLASSRTGRLYARTNPQLLPQSDRTHTIVMDVTLDDLRDEIDLGPEQYEKQVAQIDFIAFRYSGYDPDPIYSLAPGDQHLYGRVERVDGIRADSQAEANILAGLFEGWKNNEFSDVTLPLRGNYRAHDLLPHYKTTLTLTPAQNARGLDWNAQTLWTKRVTFEYRPGILLSTIVVEKDAYGEPGITGDYPAGPPVIPGPPPPSAFSAPPIISPIPAVPASGPTLTPGKGNLLYITSLKGVAKCTGAFGTDGTDGSPVWTAINSGLAGDALKIRWFNLDAFSKSGDHFTAGWAMTDDGLYRVTGLPDNPVWAQQLSPAAAAALVSGAAGYNALPYVLSHMFTPSVRLAGFIACLGFIEYTPTHFYPWGERRSFWLYSPNYGATWQVDLTKFIADQVNDNNNESFQILPSFHQDNVYYQAGGYGGKRAVQSDPNGWVARDPIWKETGTPPTPARWLIDSAVFGDGARVYFPFCNSSGSAYTDDQVGYLHRMDSQGAGTGALRRYTGLPTDAYTNIGHADMVALNWYFTNMWNENYGVAIDTGNIWLTPNQGASWTRKQSPSVGGRTLTPRYLFCAPADTSLIFFTGSASAGVALPCFTRDFGANFTDISKYGEAGALDTVLGLVAGDMVNSTIFVDYYRE